MRKDWSWVEDEAWDEDALIRAVATVRHILSSGSGCSICSHNDLRQAVGLDPYPIVHEHI